MKFIRLSLALLSAFLLTNCVSTPTTRAQKRPAAFQAIPASQQPKVMAGEITEGMSKDAVWIAWGAPSHISEAEADGSHYEVWRYTGLQPVYRNQMNMGYAVIPHGYGRYRHYHTEPFYEMNYGPDYVPYTAAVVKFTAGKVKSWERVAR